MVYLSNKVRGGVVYGQYTPAEGLLRLFSFSLSHLYLSRFASQRTPAKTRPTTVTVQLSVSTLATSVTPCISVTVG
jgi:hypothetical protein